MESKVKEEDIKAVQRLNYEIEKLDSKLELFAEKWNIKKGEVLEEIKNQINIQWVKLKT